MLRILIHAKLAATASKHSTTLEMSTNNLTCESEASEPTSSINIQLEHLARPLLLTNTVTNALIFTELNSISETIPDSLIRQKGHNSGLSLENPELLLVSGDHPFDPGGHSYIYIPDPISLALGRVLLPLSYGRHTSLRAFRLVGSTAWRLQHQSCPE